ncbi:MAG: hypothetical protein EHM61_03385 [Acidobacteria bacterium]|nr:MAG: hypothetical protein EHM61_03385 [Acidobacteriota bacterium]
MKRNPWLFLVVLVALFALSVVTSYSQSTKTFNVGGGGSLLVKVVGDVALKTSSAGSVTVEALGIAPEDLADLSITQTDNSVRVEFRPDNGHSRNIRFNIGLPDHFDVDITTAGGDVSVTGNLTGRIVGKTAGGDVRVGNVDGTTNLTTAGGDITAGKVGGDVVFKTAGGDIRLDSAEGVVQVATSGGDIIVGEVGKSLDAKTSGGDIRITNINGDANASTSGGDVRVGKVAGTATLSTAGGDIECQGATGDIKVSTAGGDVVLKAISGSLDASTAGGDIRAEFNPDGKGTSSLTTAGGELEITLPAGARARIEAVIEIEGRWSTGREEYQILSDFKALDLVMDDQHKEIRGIFEINGGGELIKMKTVNGNIQIRKAGGGAN